MLSVSCYEYYSCIAIIVVVIVVVATVVVHCHLTSGVTVTIENNMCCFCRYHCY